MKEQFPHAAEGAGFGMPILRRIGNSNRQWPRLETGLSRFGSRATWRLIANLFQVHEDAKERFVTTAIAPGKTS